MTRANPQRAPDTWMGMPIKRIVFIALTLVAVGACSGVMTSWSVAANTTTCKSFARGEAFCNKPLTAGVRIESVIGSETVSCTAGPLVIPKALANRAETYVLTAGHCIKDAGEEGKAWFAKTTAGVKMEIGKSGQFLSGEDGDVGLIKINDPGAWALTTQPTLYAVMAKWGTLGKEFPSVPVVGESTPALQRKTCMEGQMTGESCGKIVKLDETFDGTKHLVEVEGSKSAHGDSGGPLYNNESSNLLIEGTLVGERESSGHQFFEPLRTAFAEFELVKGLNLELLTTSNERRQGPYWHVNGSGFAEGIKQVALQSKGNIVLKSELAGVSITITCTASVSEGTTIEGNGAGQGQGKGRFKYSGCTVNIPKCVVAEPITTVQTKAHLAIDPNNKQQKLVEFFAPQQGTTFATLKFSGTGCGVILGSQPVKGNIAAEVVPIESEVQEGLLNFPAKPIVEVELGEQTQKTKVGLTFANEPSVLSAAYGAKLVTGEKWGVFGT